MAGAAVAENLPLSTYNLPLQYVYPATVRSAPALMLLPPILADVVISPVAVIVVAPDKAPDTF